MENQIKVDITRLLEILGNIRFGEDHIKNTESKVNEEEEEWDNDPTQIIDWDGIQHYINESLKFVREAKYLLDEVLKNEGINIEDHPEFLIEPIESEE